MAALERHDWPGNIRELQNVIERGVIMTTNSVLSVKTTENLRPAGATDPLCAPVATEAAAVKTLADAEREHIVAVLRDTNWVIGGASRGSGATRYTEDDVDCQDAAARNIERELARAHAEVEPENGSDVRGRLRTVTSRSRL